MGCAPFSEPPSTFDVQPGPALPTGFDQKRCPNSGMLLHNFRKSIIRNHEYRPHHAYF